MYKLKHLIEQKNLSKINFGNAPKSLFNFAIQNGGRAFTVKTIRPQVPDMARDIIQTIANSNTVGTRSSYSKDHVFIISADLKSNVNKDVRNVVVIPLARFEMLTKTAANDKGFEETYPDYNVLDESNFKIGTSPVIFEKDFNAAVDAFKTWLNQSEELRQANEKIKQLTANIDALNKKPTEDKEEEEGGAEEEEEEEKKPDQVSKIKIYFPEWDYKTNKAVGDPIGYTKDLFVELLSGKDRIDLSSAVAGRVYCYQQLLKQVAKHPDMLDPDGPFYTAATTFAKIPDSDFGTWGTRSQAFLKVLNDNLSEINEGPSIAKQYNINSSEVGNIITKGLIELLVDELVKRQIGFVVESKFIKLTSLVEQFRRAKQDTTNQNNTNLKQNIIKKDDIKKDDIKKDDIKKDDIKKDDIKKDDIKKKTNSLIRLANGYLWVNTYVDASKDAKFSSKILLKTTYTWPALKKLVYGKQIKVRGTKGLKKVDNSYRMYLYDDVSPYWVDDLGNVDTGTFDRNHTRWYYPDVKDGIKLTGVIKDVRIIRLPNNRAASYFYIVDGDSDGWVPSNFVSIA